MEANACLNYKEPKLLDGRIELSDSGEGEAVTVGVKVEPKSDEANKNSTSAIFYIARAEAVWHLDA
ncbi:hypothetical protein LQE92_05770 [Lacrimispora sp. NSJ-141]|uniref:Uncharacterized protein n=1 Tax=Lientehia hominis TaxID=2897778 RepID=A0AAP2RH58_9FIRM|nr:hypothetical protein [Lientehia hominis]MCD2492134.1 hypothetical protein [Lientehia hominis]